MPAAPLIQRAAAPLNVMLFYCRSFFALLAMQQERSVRGGTAAQRVFQQANEVRDTAANRNAGAINAVWWCRALQARARHKSVI